MISKNNLKLRDALQISKVIQTNIGLIRKHKGYSLDYMALKLGMSKQGYWSVERAKNGITLTRFFQIAAVLEIEPGTLIRSKVEWQSLLTITELWRAPIIT